MPSLPKDAQILIKPNFHKDLPSIVSNTTDFRLIIAVVRALQKRGYRKIIIGEGPACGFDASEINVFERLKVTELADYLGVELVNFNRAETTEIALWNNRPARIAKIIKDSDYFINLPKLKTHLLAQISAALKSLVGCFAGLQKRQMHSRLLTNIIRVNSMVKPDLIFVDVLVAMEGQGPGIGTPVVLDRIISGKNPYTIDLACAVLSGHDTDKIKLIQLALKGEHLTSEEIQEAKEKIPCLHKFTPAQPNKLVVLSALPCFMALRKYVRWIYASPLIHSILYKLELAEDVLDHDDGDYNIEFSDSPNEIDRKRCEKYCPLAMDSEEFNWPRDAIDKCLGCLYCVFLSTENSVHLEGRLGFLDYLLKHYRPWTTKIK